jgi:ankyrin repeat protein
MMEDGSKGGESDAAPRDEFLTATFWHGRVDRARALLDAHPGIAAADIFAAAAVGDDERVGRFLDAAPALATARGGPRNVDALTYLCFSCFLAHDPARSANFVKAATRLLEAGADANTGFFESADGQPPEWESALYGAAGVAFHEPLTRLLLERGANPNDNEVPYHAPEATDNAALVTLLQSGRLTDESLHMILLRKTDHHDLDGVRLALDHGARPNDIGRWGKTALHNALLSDNSLEIIELFLDRGADFTIVAEDLAHGGPPRQGRSAIALAARRGRRDVLDLLERRGIPLDLSGADPLIAACARGDATAARTIAQEHPALVEELRAEAGMLLAEFAGTGNAAGVSLLLDRGLPVDAPYAHRDAYFDITPTSTALHVAAWRASHDVVDVLVSRGADVDAVDGRGRTPLMLAVRACVDSYWMAHRSPRSVERLLGAGASRRGVPIPCGYPAVDALFGSPSPSL